MICLFPKDTNDFSTNGIKVLQPVECTVTEQINGDYSLQLTMPKDDAVVQSEMIIKVPTPKGDQLFRVYKPKADVLDNNVYQARHIFYDMLDDFIEDSRPSGTGAAAINAILSGTAFTGTSDIATQNSAVYQLMNPIKALLGGDSNDNNAFLNRWGGEIERDNFTVRMNQHVGADRGVTIRYRKNLTGLKVETDISSVVTRIYPTGRAADGQTLLTLPEKYVDSPLLSKYVHPKIQRYDYDKIQIVDKTDDSHPQLVTESQVYDQLRAAAAADFATGIDKPTVSADVEFVPLETTEEYKNDGLAGLEKVYIGDTVHISYEPLEIELTAEVVSYEYDAILQRYNKITLGSIQWPVGSVQSTIGKLATGAQISADKAQTTADAASKEVELAKVSIGDLTVRVTATEKGLESKVSTADLGTDIQQHADDIILAFNSASGSKSVKITGDGFDFYNGDTYIGHRGVSSGSIDDTLADGKSMRWNSERGDYSMSWYPWDQSGGQEGGFHCGNCYPGYINMKGGNIMNIGTLQADSIFNDSGEFHVGDHVFQVTRITTGDNKTYNALLEATS